MQYIYQSHMGGLYTTDEPQDWEDMYCETCGDSDTELGKAETIQEAWALLEDETEGCGVCDRCEKYKEEEKESNSLIPKCCKICDNEYADWGTWDFQYIMRFLERNFETEGITPIYVHLVCRSRKNDGVLVTLDDREMPCCFCISKEYIDIAAKTLCRKMNDPDYDSLRQAAVFQENGEEHYVFEVYDRSDEICKDGFYKDGGWMFWCPEKDLRLTGIHTAAWNAYVNGLTNQET